MPNSFHVCWKGLTLRIMFGSKCTLNWLSLEYINTYSIKTTCVDMCYINLYVYIYIHIFSIRGLFMSCKKTIHGCHIILGERANCFPTYWCLPFHNFGLLQNPQISSKELPVLVGLPCSIIINAGLLGLVPSSHQPECIIGVLLYHD